MKDEQSYRTTESALRERVKELTCLFQIAQIAAKPHKLLKDTLQEIVALLPSAWKYPEITQARLLLDKVAYTTPGFREGYQKLSADVVINGVYRGELEITYLDEKPEIDVGPFLKEEQYLINAVARQLELVIENKQAEEDKIKLQDQLRHADRLATIGMLAAGVAHELNEPLGNILGFAQLAKKLPEVSEQVRQDLAKIEQASLYAREIIQKLLFFARQQPLKKDRVNLNQLVENGLSFLEARCTKEDINLVRKLNSQVPDIMADPSQIHQTLVNLVVNAIQAMPEGGRLTVRTDASEDNVILKVEDTGTGMDEELIENIFMPFFTTKEMGTGLGLPVVHGIVTAHGGTIKVDSKVNFGSRFVVQLPIKSDDDSEGNS